MSKINCKRVDIVTDCPECGKEFVFEGNSLHYRANASYCHLWVNDVVCPYCKAKSVVTLNTLEDGV